MDRRDKFEQAVQQLTPHNRHGHPICRAAALGRRAGLTHEEVFAYIMENAPGDNRRPDPRMVESAIRYAENILPEDSHTMRRSLSCRRTPSPAEQWEEQRCLLPESSRNFVENMIKGTSGTTTELLSSLSERPIPNAPRAQAAAQLDALGSAPNNLVWAGWIDSSTVPPKREYPYFPHGIMSYVELSKRIMSGVVIPSHISLNPQTGLQTVMPNGKPSWDCLKTVSTCKYALLEFDDMSYQQQLDFLAGLVQWNRKKNTTWNIRSAVWSGNKSIHIIVELPANKPASDNAIGQDELSVYTSQFRRLMRLMASSDDPSYRIDISNAFTGGRAATHTRLAGAIHPTTLRYARLLYLGK